MNLKVRSIAVVLLIFGSTCSLAIGADERKEAKAMEVLNQMAAYTSSIDKLMIEAQVFSDASMGAGFVVSEPAEVSIWLDRPGSMYLERFDGVNKTKIYIHKGQLTVFGTEKNFYAQAKVPENVHDAMQFALDEFDLETPLADFFFADSALALLSDQDMILYLTDKSRVAGVDCHHIAIRGKLVDLQLWVQEGDQPLARKISVTMKWDAGSPRSTAFLDWTPVDDHDLDTFEFDPPEGAQEIKFFGSDSN